MHPRNIATALLIAGSLVSMPIFSSNAFARPASDISPICPNDSISLSKEDKSIIKPIFFDDVVARTFETTPSSEGLSLSWSVPMPHPDVVYSVERSYDGRYFDVMDYVHCVGDESSALQFVDRMIENDVYYYRVGTKTNSGKFAYTDVKRVDLTAYEAAEMFMPMSYGNVGEKLLLEVKKANQDLEIYAADAMGNVVIPKRNYTNNASAIHLGTETLAPGSYQLIVTNEGRQQRFHFVII